MMPTRGTRTSVVPRLTVRALMGIGVLAGRPVGAQSDGGWSTIEVHAEGFEKINGYFPLYWDEETGKLWLEIGRLEGEVLCVKALAAYVGSNDIGGRPRFSQL